MTGAAHKTDPSEVHKVNKIYIESTEACSPGAEGHVCTFRQLKSYKIKHAPNKLIIHIVALIFSIQISDGFKGLEAMAPFTHITI